VVQQEPRASGASAFPGSAPGFGWIRFVRYSGDDVLFSDEIETIVSE